MLGGALARVGMTAAIAFALAGCADLQLSQSQKQIVVRTGDAANNLRVEPDGPAAARLAPYALLAEQSESSQVYVRGRPVPEPSRCNAAIQDDCIDRTLNLKRASALLNQWRLDWVCDTAKKCLTPEHAKDAGDGLGVQIWVRRGLICREAIIAFRGTVGGNAGDWISNFHWVARALPGYDQYDQVRDAVVDWVNYIKDLPCYRPHQTAIVTLGHSLGGGLAQMAAYANGSVERVYAFDPSPVTGFYSGGLDRRDENVRGLKTERIYEHGEILAFGRWLMHEFVPLSACNPRIVTERFYVLEGGPLDQHGMIPLTSGILAASIGHAPEIHSAADETCATSKPAPALVAVQ